MASPPPPLGFQRRAKNIASFLLKRERGRERHLTLWELGAESSLSLNFPEYTCLSDLLAAARKLYSRAPKKDFEIMLEEMVECLDPLSMLFSRSFSPHGRRTDLELDDARIICASLGIQDILIDFLSYSADQLDKIGELSTDVHGELLVVMIVLREIIFSAPNSIRGMSIFPRFFNDLLKMMSFSPLFEASLSVFEELYNAYDTSILLSDVPQLEILLQSVSVRHFSMLLRLVLLFTMPSVLQQTHIHRGAIEMMNRSIFADSVVERNHFRIVMMNPAFLRRLFFMLQPTALLRRPAKQLTELYNSRALHELHSYGQSSNDWEKPFDLNISDLPSLQRLVPQFLDNFDVPSPVDARPSGDPVTKSEATSEGFFTGETVRFSCLPEPEESKAEKALSRRHKTVTLPLPSENIRRSRGSGSGGVSHHMLMDLGEVGRNCFVTLHQLEGFAILQALLSHRQKLRVQDEIGRCGFVRVIFAQLRALTWGRNSDRPPLHACEQECQCSPEASRKVQLLRLLHSFCERLLPNVNNKMLLFSPEERLWLSGRWPGPLGVPEQGLLLFLLEKLKEEMDCTFRFWIAAVIESFLRGGTREVLSEDGYFHPREKISRYSFEYDMEPLVDSKDEAYLQEDSVCWECMTTLSTNGESPALRSSGNFNDDSAVRESSVEEPVPCPHIAAFRESEFPPDQPKVIKFHPMYADKDVPLSPPPPPRVADEPEPLETVELTKEMFPCAVPHCPFAPADTAVRPRRHSDSKSLTDMFRMLLRGSSSSGTSPGMYDTCVSTDIPSNAPFGQREENPLSAGRISWKTVQCALVERGLLEFVVRRLLTEGFSLSTERQILFDVLGEVLMCNREVLNALVNSLTDTGLSRLISIVLRHTSEANVFFRELLLSVYYCAGPAAETMGSLILSFRCKLLREMLGSVTLENISQDNICVVNTSILWLRLLHLDESLEESLQEIREADALEGGKDILLNFRTLLWFWSTFYSKHRRDLGHLVNSTGMPQILWRKTVAMLTNDGCPGALLTYQMEEGGIQDAAHAYRLFRAAKMQ